MLAERGESLAGRTVTVSGSGNVAQFTIQKALELGAKVISASDSSGTVYDPAGFTPEKLADLCRIKNEQAGRVADYARLHDLTYLAGQRPWGIATEIALPCATQNELDTDDAAALIRNGVRLVAEGANMPTTEPAVYALQECGVLFAPGKAANAGGVATSGLEMSQNALRLGWSDREVDQRLQDIMLSIHAACVRYGRDPQSNHVDYVRGANIAGFVKVADAMLAQGVL